MALSEEKIENYIRGYLRAKGWRTTNLPKTVGAHSADVTAWHAKWRKICIVEVKGSSRSHPHQAAHNSFWTVLGQIPRKARLYCIGIPKAWEALFKRKISRMKYGWTLLRLRVFLVDDNGDVDEKPYSYFLKG
jgi:hypothetical protein